MFPSREPARATRGFTTSGPSFDSKASAHASRRRRKVFNNIITLSHPFIFFVAFVGASSSLSEGKTRSSTLTTSENARDLGDGRITLSPIERDRKPCPRGSGAFSCSSGTTLASSKGVLNYSRCGQRRASSTSPETVGGTNPGGKTPRLLTRCETWKRVNRGHAAPNRARSSS